MISNNLPVTFRGVVIKGFGRGSKQLGCPTANISTEPYKQVLENFETGIYWGTATISNHPTQTYACAISVGWCPYFNNAEKSIEIHVVAELDDFYGEEICAVAMGYIRPEENFQSIVKLKEAISADIFYATQCVKNDLFPHSAPVRKQ